MSLQYIDTYITDQARRVHLGNIVDLYMEQIKHINVTAHRSREQFEMLNILDSILPFIDHPELIASTASVADIGTGGGFPGVPLSTLYPCAQFTLCDSVAKKLDLIRSIRDQADLTNIHVQHGRFEDLGRDVFMREQFDIVLSKAVAKWHTLLEYALPFVRVGGYLYAFQGEKIKEELEQSQTIIQLLGGSYERTITYDLPSDYGKRYLVIIRKTDSTPDTYPRLVGIPKKMPL